MHDSSRCDPGISIHEKRLVRLLLREVNTDDSVIRGKERIALEGIRLVAGAMTARR
jgi:hypothetical protein